MFDRIAEAAKTVFGPKEELTNSLFAGYMDKVLSPPPEFKNTTRKLGELYGLVTGYLSEHSVNPKRKWATLGQVPEESRGDFPKDYYGRHRGSLTPASAVEIWQFERSEWKCRPPVAVSVFLGLEDGTDKHNILTLVIFPSDHGNTGVVVYQRNPEYDIKELTDHLPDKSLATVNGVSRCVSGAIKDKTINLFAVKGYYSGEGALDFRQIMERNIYNFCHPSHIASDGK